MYDRTSMSANQKSVVVISTARELDYQQDYVSLPHEYGTAAFDQREDIRAIREAVFTNLTTLDQKIQFTQKIIHRKVLIKPNLVTVFHDLGMRERDYPESTDPRVIDAVVLYLQQFTRDIQIVESAGKGIPTRAAFRIAGLDRLAKVRDVELVALEEQPVERYLLPRAQVMQEMIIPKTFIPVVNGDAFYISIPKMKTNLYTGVTLGFKNAMGTIPYFLRLRNHNHALDQKLVDMLRLFQADLVIIDGIVGGEGNGPAPVHPVQSRVIISGNHSVETDRVATRMMGIDPVRIHLMSEADQEGFNDSDVEIIGDETVTPYTQADPSLLGDWMQKNFPNVHILVGDHRAGVKPENESRSLSGEDVRRMEMFCRGGCLAATRYAFDMLFNEVQKRDFYLTVIIGPGLQVNGELLYFDRQGNPYTSMEITAIDEKKMAVGTCTNHLKPKVDRMIPGCMPFPNSAHMIVHQLSGTWCSVLSMRNSHLIPALIDTLMLCERRKRLLRQGIRIDIPWHPEDKLFPPRVFTENELKMQFIHEPFELLSKEEIHRLCREENRSILATFFP
jgi:uncharacterized protein (DUF362 family)